MCKCSNCRYGEEIITTDTAYYICLIDRTWVEMETALDDTKDCDLYVEQLDADNPKA